MRHRNVTDAEQAQIVQAYLGGSSLRQVGTMFDLHYGTIRKTLIEAGVQRRARIPQPDADTRRRIIEDYESGMSATDTGRFWGVSEATVRNYLRAAGVPVRQRSRSPERVRAAADELAYTGGWAPRGGVLYPTQGRVA